jgi:hypothetical protein
MLTVDVTHQRKQYGERATNLRSDWSGAVEVLDPWNDMLDEEDESLLSDALRDSLLAID